MPCSEFLESVGLMAIASADHFRGASGTVGDLGERAALDVAVNICNLDTVGFSAARTGFDAVFKDSDGHLVVVEAKGSAGEIKSPGTILSKEDVRGAKQMSTSWILHRAELMQDPHSSLYTQQNAALGREIQNAYHNGTLRGILVQTSGELGAARVDETTYSEKGSSDWNILTSVS